MSVPPNLPEQVSAAVEPVFDFLPPDQALSALVVGNGEPTGRDPRQQRELVELIERTLEKDALADRPQVAAGLWLYADELDRSHEISQSISTPTGSYWHAIMHRREGDFSNSKYWYRKVGHHPVMSRINPAGGGAGSGTDVGNYDPFEFVDRAERAHRGDGEQHPELVSIQRREWQALFEYSAEH